MPRAVEGHVVRRAQTGRENSAASIWREFKDAACPCPCTRHLRHEQIARFVERQRERLDQSRGKSGWRSIWRDLRNSAMICVRIVQVAGAVNSQAGNVSGACREAGIRAVRRELIDVCGV